MFFHEKIYRVKELKFHIKSLYLTLKNAIIICMLKKEFGKMYDIKKWRHIFKLDPAKHISDDDLDAICMSQMQL